MKPRLRRGEFAGLAKDHPRVAERESTFRVDADGLVELLKGAGFFDFRVLPVAAKGELGVVVAILGLAVMSELQQLESLRKFSGFHELDPLSELRFRIEQVRFDREGVASFFGDGLVLREGTAAARDERVAGLGVTELAKSLAARNEEIACFVGKDLEPRLLELPRREPLAELEIALLDLLPPCCFLH